MKQDLSDLQLHDDTLDRFLSESWLATFHGDNENLKQTAKCSYKFQSFVLREATVSDHILFIVS